MRRLGLIAALMASGAAADTSMSPETAALIAPVHAAYVEVERRQAALPPAADDRERLERLGELDQAAREIWVKIDLSVLPEDQRTLANAALDEEITTHDTANLAALKKLIPAEGWFRKSVVGIKAELAAFVIVQHAVEDPDFMRAMLPKIEAMARRGEVYGDQYALLYDRITLTFDKKPQRYGTQVECVNGKWTAGNLEDPDHLDERRASLRMQPEADYLASFREWPCS